MPVLVSQIPERQISPPVHEAPVSSHPAGMTPPASSPPFPPPPSAGSLGEAELSHPQISPKMAAHPVATRAVLLLCCGRVMGSSRTPAGVADTTSEQEKG